jgi:sugar phosphate isomerase/epimerase
MNITRRDLGRWAVAALPATAFAAQPKSTWGGVHIGMVSYSYRALPGSAEQVASYCVNSGVDAVEMMSQTVEAFAGSPAKPFAPLPRGTQPTPEMIAERKKMAAEVAEWRLKQPMDKFKAFRKVFEDMGVKVYGFKLPPTLEMPDAEYAYIWNVAEALGSDQITMELPEDDKLLARVAAYAAKRKRTIAFHTHGQGGTRDFDKVLAASPYTALNFDVGHYYGITGESPVPVVEKYHARIASLHIKNRKGPADGSANVAFDVPGTPVKELLLLMKQKKYKFPASVEFEYPVPEGSDVLTEVKKCVDYCKNVLA